MVYRNISRLKPSKSTHRHKGAGPNTMNELKPEDSISLQNLVWEDEQSLLMNEQNDWFGKFEPWEEKDNLNLLKSGLTLSNQKKIEAQKQEQEKQVPDPTDDFSSTIKKEKSSRTKNLIVEERKVIVSKGPSLLDRIQKSEKKRADESSFKKDTPRHPSGRLLVFHSSPRSLKNELLKYSFKKENIPLLPQFASSNSTLTPVEWKQNQLFASLTLQNAQKNLPQILKKSPQSMLTSSFPSRKYLPHSSRKPSRLPHPSDREEAFKAFNTLLKKDDSWQDLLERAMDIDQGLKRMHMTRLRALEESKRRPYFKSDWH